MTIQSKIRSKICGITRVEDALAASALGVDAIGLVFYEKSKRFVCVKEARAIARAVGPFVSVVALFVNETAERIEAILREVPIDVIQFHGDESVAFCEQFNRPYLKAIRVRNGEDMLQAARDFPSARALLFDVYIDGEYGGTGHSFDWKMLPKDLGCHWILSGGLTPENVAEAVCITDAKAVDISSGVERTAGVKCPQKMAAFLAALKQG